MLLPDESPGNIFSFGTPGIFFPEMKVVVQCIGFIAPPTIIVGKHRRRTSVRLKFLDIKHDGID